MNKRQKKKKSSKMKQRYSFIFGNGRIVIARQNGKTGVIIKLFKIITEKSYKNYKKLKKAAKR